MFCEGVKEFLSQSQTEFVDRDITVDDGAMEELEKLGIMTTPVTVIDGQAIVGFDQVKFKELLGLS